MTHLPRLSLNGRDKKKSQANERLRVSALLGVSPDNL